LAVEPGFRRGPHDFTHRTVFALSDFPELAHRASGEENLEFLHGSMLSMANRAVKIFVRVVAGRGASERGVIALGI
jgi:hypothetical protein